MEQQKLTNQKETLAFLNNKYPKCFFLEGAVKPLKIGIFQDLAAELEGVDFVSKRLLRNSLRHYTSSWRYLSAIKVDASRVNLQGEAVAQVEQQHADHAAEQLKESKAKAAQIREAKAKENKGKTKDKFAKHKGLVNKSSKTAKGDLNKTASPSSTKHKSNRQQKNKHTSPKQSSDKLKKIVPLADNDLVLGKNVLVKLGSDPMPVTITDISKDGISVQLKSGMTVKVQQQQLFCANKDGVTG